MKGIDVQNKMVVMRSGANIFLPRGVMVFAPPHTLSHRPHSGFSASGSWWRPAFLCIIIMMSLGDRELSTVSSFCLFGDSVRRQRTVPCIFIPETIHQTILTIVSYKILGGQSLRS